jgi:hypothetical protein
MVVKMNLTERFALFDVKIRIYFVQRKPLEHKMHVNTK